MLPPPLVSGRPLSLRPGDLGAILSPFRAAPALPAGSCPSKDRAAGAGLPLSLLRPELTPTHRGLVVPGAGREQRAQRTGSCQSALAAIPRSVCVQSGLLAAFVFVLLHL